MSAAEGVVLPMPMSPVTSSLAPRSSASRATSAPTLSAARASSVLMAGPSARFAVPWRTLRARSPWASPGIGDATPTSTTTTEAPTWRASTLMAAPPAQKFATICAVTSEGHGVTPASHDAVVACEDGDRRRFGHRRGARTRDRRQLHAERLKETERPLGLRQSILQRACRQRGSGVGRGHAKCEFAEGARSCQFLFNVDQVRRQDARGRIHSVLRCEPLPRARSSRSRAR